MAAIVATDTPGYLRVVGSIPADRLEHRIDVVRGTECCDESRVVESMGTKLVEYSTPVIKQWLDINELERLVAVLKHALAKVETQGPFLIELTSAFKIVGGRRPENPRCFQ